VNDAVLMGKRQAVSYLSGDMNGLFNAQNSAGIEDFAQ